MLKILRKIFKKQESQAEEDLGNGGAEFYGYYDDIETYDYIKENELGWNKFLIKYGLKKTGKGKV
jgi:hypothetical protein